MCALLLRVSISAINELSLKDTLHRKFDFKRPYLEKCKKYSEGAKILVLSRAFIRFFFNKSVVASLFHPRAKSLVS